MQRDTGTIRSLSNSFTGSYAETVAKRDAEKLAALQRARFESSVLGRVLAWWKAL